jgi:hypothetical protein
VTKYIRESLGLALIVFSAASCGNSDDNAKGATCAAPPACGGALDGTWQVDSICIQGNLVAVENANSGLPTACNTLYQSASYSSSGTVTYANGTQTANVTSTSSTEALYTQACATAILGVSTTLDASTCASLQQSNIDSGQYTSATCTYSSEGCRCALNSQSTDTSAVSYTISGNRIVFTNGDPPLDYCVSGKAMTFSTSYNTAQGMITSVSTLHHI